MISEVLIAPWIWTSSHSAFLAFSAVLSPSSPPLWVGWGLGPSHWYQYLDGSYPGMDQQLVFPFYELPNWATIPSLLLSMASFFHLICSWCLCLHFINTYRKNESGRRFIMSNTSSEGQSRIFDKLSWWLFWKSDIFKLNGFRDLWLRAEFIFLRGGWSLDAHNICWLSLY